MADVMVDVYKGYIGIALGVAVILVLVLIFLYFKNRRYGDVILVMLFV